MTEVLSPPLTPLDLFVLEPLRALEYLATSLERSTQRQEEDDLPSDSTPPSSPTMLRQAINDETCRRSSAGQSLWQAEDEDVQRNALTRRFWSKSVPDIDVRDYLLRIHRFCPLSTAVYIATSLYIDSAMRFIPLTQLTIHRLTLAALRIASKNLEDQTHPQRRFAQVGGLSESELSRLEVAFLFLVDFNLRVDAESLQTQGQKLLLHHSTGLGP